MSAAHSLLAVFVGVVKAWQIRSHGDYGSHGKHACRLEPSLDGLVLVMLYEICDYQRRYDEQEIVGHLRMVGGKLKHGEERRKSAAGKVTPAIAHHDSGYRRRHIGEGGEFPDMPGSYDYEKI